MKCKKVISGLLSFAMVATSVFTGDMVTTVKAAEVPEPLAVYDFNNETLGSASGEVSGESEFMATPYTAGLAGEYTGNVVYGAGRTGDAADKALTCDGYGINLPHRNIGSEFTYSMWIMPTGDLVNFQAVTQFGVCQTDNASWLSLAGGWESGEDGADNERFVLWDASKSLMGAEEEIAFYMPKNKWSMLTVTHEANKMSVYLDGKHLGTTKELSYDILNAENAGICVGVNNFPADGTFPGLVDDIAIYNTALSDAQVRYLYDGKGAEEIFAEEGFTASSALSMMTGEKRVINITLPDLVNPDDATITYESADTAVATVENGTVSGVGVGETTVTTTVKLGETTKSQTTTVTVKSGENVTEGVAVEYDLTGIVDGQIKDTTGRGNHATVQGESGLSFTEGEDGETVMVMASNDSWLELPTTIMDSLTNKEQFTIETKFAKSSACGKNAWLFCFGSNVKSTGTNYMFLSPNFDSKTLRAGIKNSGTEKLFGTAIQPVVDEWYTVNMVFDEGIVKLYWNGVLIQGDNGTQLDSGYSIMDDVVTPGTTSNADILGYIGKSCWSADKNYQGKLASFKIYDKAMTDEEIQLSNPQWQENFAKNLDLLTEEDMLGSNASASEVKYNLNLAASVSEINVTWASDNEDVITADGIVKNAAEDKTVTLTATMTSGALSASKDFTVTVKALDKTVLEATIAEAQAVAANQYADPATTAAVLAEIDKAATASTQTEVDNAVKKIKKAMSKVELLDV